MTARTGSGTTLSAVADRIRDFWAYYRRYTDTAIHAAATAALTAFGLLIFIDPSFAWLAIASYVLPPAVLYAIGNDAGIDRSAGAERPDETNRPTGRRTTVVDGGSDSGADSHDGGPDVDVGADHDTDAEAGGPEHDHDGFDRDVDGIDADADGPDLDFDAPDRDTDGSDFDGPDRDVDGSDGDADGPDRDADGADHDHDGVDGDADGTDSDSDGVDVDRDG